MARVLASCKYTLAIIKPDTVESGQVPTIFKNLLEKNIEVLQQQLRHITEEDLKYLYGHLASEQTYEGFIKYMTSAPSLILILTKFGHEGNIVQEWRRLLGPANVEKAREVAPDSLRAKYGKEGFSNALHGSASPSHAQQELEFFFPNLKEEIATQIKMEKLDLMSEYSVVILKPNVISKFGSDGIIRMLEMNGLYPISQRQITFTEEKAEEFYSNKTNSNYYEAYKDGVLRGSCVALAIGGLNIIKKINTALGPEILTDIKGIDQQCVRQQLQIDGQIISGIHASLSPEDARRELELLFPRICIQVKKVEKEMEEETIRIQGIQDRRFLKMQHIIAAVMPHAMKFRDIIIQRLRIDGITVLVREEIKMTSEEAYQFLQEFKDQANFQEMVKYLSKGNCMVLVLTGEGISAILPSILGPFEVEKAIAQLPTSVGAMYNAGISVVPPIIANMDQEISKANIKKFLPECQYNLDKLSLSLVSPQSAPLYGIIVLGPPCLVHPKKEDAMNFIKKCGLQIEIIQELTVNRDLVKYMFPEYPDTIVYEKIMTGMTNGQSVIIGVSGDNCISQLKKCIGPINTNLARKTYPESIRAVLSDPNENFSLVYGTPTDVRVMDDLSVFLPDLYNTVILEILESVSLYEHSMVIVSPLMLALMDMSSGGIKQEFIKAGFVVIAEKKIKLSVEEIKDLYETDDYTIINTMMSSVVVLLGIYGRNVIDEINTSLTSGLFGSITSNDKYGPIPLRGSKNYLTAKDEMAKYFPEELTLAIIKPDAFQDHKGKIVKMIKDFGLKLVDQKMMDLSTDIAEDLYRRHLHKPYYNELINFMTSGKVFALALQGYNAVNNWNGLRGPPDPIEARSTAPKSIRALFGKNSIQNAVHGSSAEDANDELKLIFGNEKIRNYMVYSVKVSRPHIDPVQLLNDRMGFISTSTSLSEGNLNSEVPTVLHNKQNSFSQMKTESASSFQRNFSSLAIHSTLPDPYDLEKQNYAVDGTNFHDSSKYLRKHDLRAKSPFSLSKRGASSSYDADNLKPRRSLESTNFKSCKKEVMNQKGGGLLNQDTKLQSKCRGKSKPKGTPKDCFN